MHRFQSLKLLLLAPVLFAATPSAQPGDKDKAGKDPPEKAEKVLRSPSKSIVVVSDRDEAVPAFFQRQRIIVGRLAPKKLKQLAEAKGPEKMLFVNYTSHNDDEKKMELFGDFLTVAPVRMEVHTLIAAHVKEKKGPVFVNVVLKRDEREAGVYHVVGFIHHNTVGFFRGKYRTGTDDFSPMDLRFKEEKK
jgi:hypothetical protein